MEADVLKLVLSYCRYHRAEGRSDKERKLFDEKFIRMDTRRLCELTSAADACALPPHMLLLPAFKITASRAGVLRHSAVYI